MVTVKRHWHGQELNSVEPNAITLTVWSTCRVCCVCAALCIWFETISFVACAIATVDNSAYTISTYVVCSAQKLKLHEIQWPRTERFQGEFFLHWGKWRLFGQKMQKKNVFFQANESIWLQNGFFAHIFLAICKTRSIRVACRSNAIERVSTVSDGVERSKQQNKKKIIWKNVSTNEWTNKRTEKSDTSSKVDPTHTHSHTQTQTDAYTFTCGKCANGEREKTDTQYSAIRFVLLSQCCLRVCVCTFFFSPLLFAVVAASAASALFSLFLFIVVFFFIHFVSNYIFVQYFIRNPLSSTHCMPFVRSTNNEYPQHIQKHTFFPSR